MPIKTFEKEDFKFEISETLCGSLAYKFYHKDQEIFRNNNYYPSPAASKDDSVMFEELVKIVVNEKKITPYSKKEKFFLESESFIKLKKMVDIP